jgi:hypothetical protein
LYLAGAPHARFNFDLPSFVKKYSLGDKVASNYMIAYADSHADYARP